MHRPLVSYTIAILIANENVTKRRTKACPSFCKQSRGDVLNFGGKDVSVFSHPSEKSGAMSET